MATKQEILSKLAASHEQRISKVLFDLEEDIIAQLQRATDGVPLTTQLAIQLRPNLKTLIEQNYLKEGTKIISEYDEVVKSFMDFTRTIPDDLVSPKFKTLTKPDLVLINQLKQLSFSGFEDVANRFLDTIATEIYSSAVTGKPFPQVVENIRASVNGVYRRSNEAAVNRLVAIVEENRYSDDPIAKKKYLDARKILHSKYASDIRGENMRKYASQIAHDSIMQFDGQFTKHKGQEAGINTYKYTGTNITTTRQFCRGQLNEIKSEEEWRNVFTGNWRGKSGSDPFVNRGGYRCRHSLIPYNPAWDTIEEVQTKVQPKATNIKTSADAATNVSSLASPIKLDDVVPVTKAYLVNKLNKQFQKNKEDYVKYEDGRSPVRHRGTKRENYGNVRFANKRSKGRFYEWTEKDYGIIEAMMQELDDLAVKYGVPKLRSISPNAGSAVASMGDGKLNLNVKYLALEETASDLSLWKRGDDIKNRPFTADSYFTNKLDKIRSTYYHEFAHQIHQQKFVGTTSQYFSPKLEQDLIQLGGKWRNQGATRYSEKNAKEWFAENFTLYEMGKTELVDPNFITFLKEKVL
jgi:hypothetical protein|tara:strand:+ start:975 stop:2708 length:1734 start_codon:yes stop_codon:yes gene_type:complete